MSEFPTNEEYMRLASDWQAAETVAEKNRIATVILLGLDKLIYKIVLRVAGRFEEAMQEDCYAEAQLAIIKGALPNYSEDKLGANCKFSSYVGQWVYQAAKRHLDKTATTVIFPSEGRQRVLRAIDNGEELSEDDRAYAATTVYWDTPAGKDGDKSNGQTMADRICATEEVFDRVDVIENIHSTHEAELCAILLDDPVFTKATYIVKEYLQGRTLPELAKELGMSKSNASHLYREHIKRLRQRVALASTVRSRNGKHNKTSADTRLDVLVRINENLKLEKRGGSGSS